jgi:hypothetical protein
MVTKQYNTALPPEIDESWWTALLAEEEKFNQVGSKDQIIPDELVGRGKDTVKRGGKSSEIDWQKV